MVNPEEFFEKAGYVIGFIVGIDVRMETQEEDAAGGIAQLGIFFAGTPMDIPDIFMKAECFNVGGKDRIINVFNDATHRAAPVTECLFNKCFP